LQGVGRSLKRFPNVWRDIQFGINDGGCVSKESILESKRRYYYKNIEKIRIYQKKYREANKAICYQRQRRSEAKKKQQYIDKRRENYRKKRGIPLDDPFRKRKDGEGNIDAQGYKTITKKGHPNQTDSKGRIREHVYVMSEHLGRPLYKDESVHHKNGDRLDNAIENLELWSKKQPPGQRVEDKINFYIEYLNRYGYKVSKE
jgi:hypothetical protein